MNLKGAARPTSARPGHRGASDHRRHRLRQAAAVTLPAELTALQAGGLPGESGRHADHHRVGSPGTDHARRFAAAGDHQRPPGATRRHAVLSLCRQDQRQRHDHRASAQHARKAPRALPQGSAGRRQRRRFRRPRVAAGRLHQHRATGCDDRAADAVAGRGPRRHRCRERRPLRPGAHA